MKCLFWNNCDITTTGLNGQEMTRPSHFEFHVWILKSVKYWKNGIQQNRVISANVNYWEILNDTKFNSCLIQTENSVHSRWNECDKNQI